MNKYGPLNAINPSAVTSESYGAGDLNFAAVTVHSVSGRPIAVEIPCANIGRSGSNYYKPDSRLLAAVNSVKTEGYLGGHMAQFVKSLIGPGYGAGLTPEHSASDTATNKGAINAMSAALQYLHRQNLLLDVTTERTIEEAKSARIAALGKPRGLPPSKLKLTGARV